jgi:hypothetical protein
MASEKFVSKILPPSLGNPGGGKRSLWHFAWQEMQKKLKIEKYNNFYGADQKVRCVASFRTRFGIYAQYPAQMLK